MREFLIDTDPGVDDALAIIMCRMAPDVQVRALSVCGGNVGLPHTLRNALHLADQFATPPKVYPGVAQALIARAPDAAFVHGNDGFGDANLPAPINQAQHLHAALAIIEHARQAEGQLEILALGPLTNLALAITLEPNFPKMVKILTVMGGAITGVGNITAHAEFNIAVDPDAAQIVFTRWPNLRLVDWEASMRYAPSIAITESWFAQDHHNARFMQRISRKTRAFKDSLGGEHWHWADPLAAFVALQPDQADYLNAGIEVIREGLAAGATLLNHRTGNCKIARDIDMSAFHAAMARSLAA
jgi:purine nucleosidase